MDVNMKVAIPILLVLAFVVYGAYDLAISMQDKKFLEVEAKMGDGSVVDITDEALHATIGEAYGIEEIRFTINVKNTGEMPLTVTIDSLSPTSLSNSLAGATPKQAAAGNTVTWTTNWISVSPFIGTTPSFEVVVSAVDSLGRSITKSDSISFAIMPDPEIGIDVSITSGSSEGSGTDPSAPPTDECSEPGVISCRGSELWVCSSTDNGNELIFMDYCSNGCLNGQCITSSTCTDECTFYEQQCHNGHVYNCVMGSDGCRNLVLVENCGTSGCSGGQCMTQTSCTEQETMVYGSNSKCVFTCSGSQRDCTYKYFSSSSGRWTGIYTLPLGQTSTHYACSQGKITKCV